MSHVELSTLVSVSNDLYKRGNTDLHAYFEGLTLQDYSDFLVGTPGYFAPEIQSKMGAKVNYTKQSDVWALGSVLLNEHDLNLGKMKIKINHPKRLILM